MEVLSHYTNPVKCVRCGIDDIRILSIDHINGNGAEHQRQIKEEAGIKKATGIALYRWLKKHGYPEGYQVMCLNCNFIKRLENKDGYKK